LLLIIAVAILIVACTDLSTTHTYITENDIREIMNKVKTATLNKDIDSVVKYMAPSVVIDITVETVFGPQKHRWSREQYRDETKKVFSMTSHYEYKCENEKITISDDRKSAVVETDVVEVMVIQGRRNQTMTHEKTTLEIVDGKLLVTKLEGTVRNTGASDFSFM
jgi:ketosteroid isomerase-like protein